MGSTARPAITSSTPILPHSTCEDGHLRCHADPACHLDGHWGAWGPWSPCSHRCREGTQVRGRACDNPAPQHGGRGCAGGSQQQRACRGQLPCEGDGPKDTGLSRGWGSSHIVAVPVCGRMQNERHCRTGHIQLRSLHRPPGLECLELHVCKRPCVPETFPSQWAARREKGKLRLGGLCKWPGGRAGLLSGAGGHPGEPRLTVPPRFACPRGSTMERVVPVGCMQCHVWRWGADPHPGVPPPRLPGPVCAEQDLQHPSLPR